MTADLPPEARLGALLDHLGIIRAHVGAQLVTDVAPLLTGRPDAVSSLTMVAPFRLEVPALAPVAGRLLVVSGDGGVAGATVAATLPHLPGARALIMPDYDGAPWKDVAGERKAAIQPAMTAFLADAEAARPATPLRGGQEGEVAGIRYRVVGEGPALLLFPKMFSAAQWEALLPALAARAAVVVLGGRHLGGIAILEGRGTAPGYLRVVRAVMDEVALAPGETVLDVGCGSGAIDRWLARRTEGRNPIIATDLNPYVLGEARALAAAEGLGQAIDFRVANAEALSFPDASVDAAISFTVMEECDAARMLGEMVRVVRPGGRVAVVVRAVDARSFWNLPIDAALRAKVEAPQRLMAPAGCADASLYARFRAAGLQDLRLFPHVLTFDDAANVSLKHQETHVLSLLDAAEIEAWNRAKAAAVAAGTFLLGRPLHCAVGTKGAP